jgi:steroid delta-isomerase-like uncharacterized protein
MSTEENKALVRRYVEDWNKRNLAALEIFAPDYVFHGAFPPGFSPDLAGGKQLRMALWTAFPDMHATVENLIAEGDKVASRWTLRGTHQGDLMGIPPTGKQVSLTMTSIDRFEAGKCVESWGDADALGFLQQLGAIPEMAQAGA